ncbi:hypothetical protein NDU88_006969 [Pleurodeles waltl]|uniref:Uncharacterized protein n=1 Tax=Pleurodeles waltl TaxID=8319 RepID=A0AAV7SQZ9_PLEWA|nr:hypothetical protein NDU88_006969 [Pleurodeles waltl]
MISSAGAEPLGWQRPKEVRRRPPTTRGGETRRPGALPLSSQSLHRTCWGARMERCIFKLAAGAGTLLWHSDQSNRRTDGVHCPRHHCRVQLNYVLTASQERLHTPLFIALRPRPSPVSRVKHGNKVMESPDGSLQGLRCCLSASRAG